MPTFSAATPIIVSDHALWRYAERFRESVYAGTIEGEVRDALAAGRVTTDRTAFGLLHDPNGLDLFVSTLDGKRVYALRIDRTDETRLVVATTMRVPDRTNESTKHDARRRRR